MFRKIEAIVPCAGLGIRLKSKISKPLVLIAGHPVVFHTLKRLTQQTQISKIIVLAHKRNLSRIKTLIKHAKIKKVKCVLCGGDSRKDSVSIGLKFLDKDTRFVLIHDGVRPFISKKIISAVIVGAQRYGAAVTGVPLKPTVKSVKVSNLPAGKAGCQRIFCSEDTG